MPLIVTVKMTAECRRTDCNILGDKKIMKRLCSVDRRSGTCHVYARTSSYVSCARLSRNESLFVCMCVQLTTTRVGAVCEVDIEHADGFTGCVMVKGGQQWKNTDWVLQLPQPKSYDIY